MADMCYYGNVILHLQQYSHRLNLFNFFVFLFLVFLFFWSVVAYCTQLLSQAMYNLMMATTMAETCSC